MPAAQCPPTESTWTIHSVTVRTRDAAQRLDHAYRRLLDSPPPATQRLPGAADPAMPTSRL
jgi:hypothetical protein